MKVILTQDIKGLGKKMDVKEVADGYAHHLLIPKKLAVPANEKELAMKSQWDNSQEHNIARYREYADKLKTTVLEFVMKTGEHGAVFSSITGKDIEKALNAKGIKDFKLELKKHLKTLGEHEVEVTFGKGITAKAKVVLKAEEK